MSLVEYGPYDMIIVVVVISLVVQGSADRCKQMQAAVGKCRQVQAVMVILMVVVAVQEGADRCTQVQTAVVIVEE